MRGDVLMDNMTFSKLDEQENVKTEKSSDCLIQKEPEFNITGTALNIL